jgi:MFS family permease
VTADTRTPHLTSWRTAVFLTFAVNGFGMAAWVARIPSVRDRLGISVSEVGILIVGVSAGSIVGLILAGHVVAWLGGRSSLRIALTLSGVALIVVGAGTSIASFAVVILGLAIFGIANSLCDVAMNVEGAGVERSMGRTIMPWFHASWSFGTVIGAGLGAAAAFAGIDPVWHLGAVALIQIVVTQIVVSFLPQQAPQLDEHGAEAPELTFAQRMGIWLEPRTLVIGLIVLGMAFTEGSANDWLALAMVDDRGLDNGQGALLFGVFTVSMTIGRIAGVPLIDRFGRVAVLRGSAAAAAIGLALLILVPAIPVAVIGIVLWGLGASLGFPLGMSAAGDDPLRAAARVSAVATIGYLAFLGGPPLIGAVGQHVGLLNALWIVLGLILLTFLVAPAARERSGRFARLR